MTKIQEEVMESAQLTDAQERAIKEESQIMQMLHHLAPWLEKTDGEELIGNWETTLATRMMIKLLELWLTEESRQHVEKMLEFYHPLDRAAMAYALLNQGYKVACRMFKDDMPTLMFAGHMRYMIRRYGKKKINAESSTGGDVK